MADCKDKQFDLAIVDPPYGIKADRQHTEGWGWISRKSNGWDKKIPPPIYFTELQRISKNRIICGGNYFTDHLLQSSGWVVWDKGQRDFSLADGELIYTSFNVALRIFNYSRGKFSSEREGFHPTEKPIALYKWLLKNYAKPGDKIFDSHMGSQSSRIACYEGGFDFIGCELDKEYFDAGCKRFEIYKQQLKINF
jgi:site-specific DNA-methyltransferase (adenine-specific)